MTATAYTVKPGDTLTGIARLVGVGWVDIAEANRDKIRNYNLSQINNGAYNVIRVGDVLTIPGDAQPSTGFLFPSESGGGGGSSAKSMSPIVIILAVAAVAYLASR